MILASFTNETTGGSSYLIGDRVSGVAVIIDPDRDVGQYLDAAAEEGLQIGHAIATDRHALLSPLYELKKRAGTLIHSLASGPPLFSINALMPGSSFTFGRLRFTVPEGQAGSPRLETLYVYDLESESSAPILIASTTAHLEDGA